VIAFVKTLPKTIANAEIAKQVIRSSSSVGANYIEANESLSKKDFVMRIKICRKEAKESIFWLKEAVQQFKIGRKRKANRALNPKRSKIFGAKSNCGTASKLTEIKTSESEKKSADRRSNSTCQNLQFNSGKNPNEFMILILVLVIYLHACSVK
jgi:four helix bundle protein